MKILRRLGVPTGDILIVEGTHGNLEMLSLGDYGKEVNLKCDALGLSRSPAPVVHQAMLPLTQKWVLTISTQYGCRMACSFCDVPQVGPGRNATLRDLQRQVVTGLHLHPEITGTQRLNVHFARMGEPTWNPNVLDAARWLKLHIDPEFRVHPVVSTMMPSANKWLRTFIHTWMRIKNRLYGGNAGLQLSINSTDDAERDHMYSGGACTLAGIREIMDGVVPIGRKITLNFAMAGWMVDPDTLLRYFSPEDYIIKLTPMHKTAAADASGLATPGDYTTPAPHEKLEERLKGAGYDVLVFIASREEDLGRITCGNAILSGTLPEVEYTDRSDSAQDARAEQYWERRFSEEWA